MTHTPDEAKKGGLYARLEKSQATAKALAKDVAALKRQSAVLKQKAAQARSQARSLRAPPPEDVLKILWTIPEACVRLHVAERTLRAVLAVPPFQARLIERTHKVGIYYKFIESSKETDRL